jgi:hypothetical protein
LIFFKSFFSGLFEKFSSKLFFHDFCLKSFSLIFFDKLYLKSFLFETFLFYFWCFFGFRRCVHGNFERRGSPLACRLARNGKTTRTGVRDTLLNLFTVAFSTEMPRSGGRDTRLEKSVASPFLQIWRDREAPLASSGPTMQLPPTTWRLSSCWSAATVAESSAAAVAEPSATASALSRLLAAQ